MLDIVKEKFRKVVNQGGKQVEGEILKTRSFSQIQIVVKKTKRKDCLSWLFF